MSFLKDHIGRRIPAPPGPSPCPPGFPEEMPDTHSAQDAAVAVMTRFLRACCVRRRAVTQLLVRACAAHQETPRDTSDDVTATRGISPVRFPFVRLTHFALVRARQHRLLIRTVARDSDEEALHKVVSRLFDYVTEEVVALTQTDVALAVGACAETSVRSVLEVCAVVFYTHAVVTTALATPSTLVAQTPYRVVGFVNRAFLKCTQLLRRLIDPDTGLLSVNCVQRPAAAALLVALLGRQTPSSQPHALWPLLMPTSVRCRATVLCKLPDAPPLAAKPMPKSPKGGPSHTQDGLCDGGHRGVAVHTPLLAFIRTCFIDRFVSCPDCVDGGGNAAEGPLPNAPSTVCSDAVLTLLRQLHQSLLSLVREGSMRPADGRQPTDMSLDLCVNALRARLFLTDHFLVPLTGALGGDPDRRYCNSPILAPFLAGGCGTQVSAPPTTTEATKGSISACLRQTLLDRLTRSRAAAARLTRVSETLQNAYTTQWLAQISRGRPDQDRANSARHFFEVHLNPFERDGQLLVRLSVANLLVRVALKPQISSSPSSCETDVERVCRLARQQWKPPFVHVDRTRADAKCAQPPSIAEPWQRAEVELLRLAHTQRCCPARTPSDRHRAATAEDASLPFTSIEHASWLTSLAALLKLSVCLWRTALTEAVALPASTKQTALVTLSADWLHGPLYDWRLTALTQSTMSVRASSEAPAPPTPSAGPEAAEERRLTDVREEEEPDFFLFFRPDVLQSVVTRLGSVAVNVANAAMSDALRPCFRVLWDHPVSLLLSTPLDAPSFVAALTPEEQQLVAAIVATQSGWSGTYTLTLEASADARTRISTAATSDAKKDAGPKSGSALSTLALLATRLRDTFRLSSRSGDAARCADEMAALEVCQTRFTDDAHDIVESLRRLGHQGGGVCRGGAARGATDRRSRPSQPSQAMFLTAKAEPSILAMRTLSQLRTYQPHVWTPIASFILQLSILGAKEIAVSYLLHGELSIAGFLHHCCGGEPARDAQPPSAHAPAQTQQLQQRPQLMYTFPDGGTVVVYPPSATAELADASSPSLRTSSSRPPGPPPCAWLSVVHSPSTTALLELYMQVLAPRSNTPTTPMREMAELWSVCWPAVQAVHGVHVAYSTLGSMLVSVLMLQDDAGVQRGTVLPLSVLRTATYLSNFYVLTRILILNSRPVASRRPAAAAASVDWARLLHALEQEDAYGTCTHFAQSLKLLSHRSVRVEGLSHMLSTFSPSLQAIGSVAKLAEGDVVSGQCLFSLPHLFPFSTRVAVLRGRIKQCAELYSTSTVHVYRTFTGRTVTFRVAEKFHLSIRRAHLLDDALTQVQRAQRTMAGSRLLYSTWHVTFIGAGGIPEAGIDVGGLFKEFWELCVNALLNVDRGLFISTASEDGGSEDVVLAGRLYPNPHAAALVGSAEAAEALFSFTGLLLAKGISEGLVMPNTFATFFLSNLVGSGVCLEDLGDLDPVAYRSLRRLRDMSNVEDACLFFTYEDESLGTRTVYDLVPNGRHIPVTNANVVRYLHMYAHHRLSVSTRLATDAFREGLTMLLAAPANGAALVSSRAPEVDDGLRLLRLFSAVEVRQLFSGAETDGTGAAFDVADLEHHTVCQGASRRVARHLFDVLRELNCQDQGLFLRFCTGSSRPPLMGFQAMQPPFTITGADVGPQSQQHADGADSNGLRGPLAFFGRLFRSSETRDNDSGGSSGGGGHRSAVRLPTASTCFNALHLPEYESKAVLKERLLVAIRSDSGFGLS